MRSVEARYDLLPGSKAAGYFAAVFVGAGATAILLTGAQAALAIGGVLFGEASVGSGAFLSLFPSLLFTFLIALAVWVVGGLLALPLWFVLHRVGLRGPVTAASAGAGLVTTTYLLLLAPSIGGASSADEGLTVLVWTVVAVVIGGCTGGLAGYALWRVAYRRCESGASQS